MKLANRLDDPEGLGQAGLVLLGLVLLHRGNQRRYKPRDLWRDWDRRLQPVIAALQKSGCLLAQRFHRYRWSERRLEPAWAANRSAETSRPQAT